MDMEMQVEPIVAKAVIQEKARDHADAGDATPIRNPYPPGTHAHHSYEIYFWERVRWLAGEETE